jgi:hypothetical protein
MKKIFTLLFAVGFLTAVNAQPGSRDDRDDQQNDQRDREYSQRDDQPNAEWDNNDGYSNQRDVVIYNDRRNNDNRYDNRNGSNGRGRMEMQIAMINRKYDYQIQRVRNDFFMGRNEKMRAIRSLEMQRQREVKMMYARAGNRNGQIDRRYDSNRRY